MHAGRDLVLDLRNRGRGHLGLAPATEGLLEKLLHRLAVEITGHAEDGVVGMDVDAVELDEIVATDVRDGVLGRQPRPGTRGPVHQPPEVQLGHVSRIVPAAPDVLDDAGLLHLQAGGVEARRAQHRGEDAQRLGELVLHRGDRAAQHVVPGAQAHLRRHELERLVDLVRGLAVRAAGAHERRGQRSEARLRGRIEHAPGLEIDGRIDQGQLVVLEQVDQEAVRQEHLHRLGEGDRQGRVGQRPRVRGWCRERSRPRRRGHKGEDGQRQHGYGASHRIAPGEAAGVIAVPSSPAAPAFPPPADGRSSTATVRLEGTKVRRAASCTCAAVVAWRAVA